MAMRRCAAFLRVVSPTRSTPRATPTAARKWAIRSESLLRLGHIRVRGRVPVLRFYVPDPDPDPPPPEQ